MFAQRAQDCLVGAFTCRPLLSVILPCATHGLLLVCSES